MQIERTTNGFLVDYDDGAVKRIECVFHKTLTLFYRNQETCTLNIPTDVFHSQYGCPVTKDGELLFLGDWSKRKGLQAFDSRTGERIWQYQQPRIRNIFVYDAYLIAVSAYDSIKKLDVQTGMQVAEIRSGTIEQAFQLCEPFVFIDTFRGKYSILNIETMQIVHTYPREEVNPQLWPSLLLLDVKQSSDTLILSGFEGSHDTVRFERALDASGISAINRDKANL